MLISVSLTEKEVLLVRSCLVMVRTYCGSLVYGEDAGWRAITGHLPHETSEKLTHPVREYSDTITAIINKIDEHNPPPG